MLKIHIFLIFIITCISKLTHLDLTPHKHLLILYSDKSQQSTSEKIQFKIDFNSTQFILSKQIQYLPGSLYFHHDLKYQVPDSLKVVRKTMHKSLKEAQNAEEVDEEVHGVVGFGPYSDFFKALKETLNTTHIKFWIKIYENTVQLIKQSCSNAIFPPYELEIETGVHNLFLNVPNLSLQFHARTSTFLGLLEKQTSPFVLSPSEMGLKLNIQFLNVIQTVPLRAILSKKCRKISGSPNYECSFQQEHKVKETDDFGLLLLQFQPILCSDRTAIELKQEGKIDSTGYYWSHLSLIVLEIGLVVLFQYRNSISKKITCFLKNRKLK